ncbi:protein-L-isoaspartate(D-aspartate) O-methyltransferase [Kitasatospora sp. NPDC056783]|uniref:protein-L-isoaspartate(D-aspartate) O-methyltransferase n=1 Tax=Kitasatospora sp. NPDC056783 TaxID=3345943 RepID=UPI003677E106
MDQYAQLLAGLTEAGALGEEWRGAFERAPRSAFVPDTVWTPDEDAPAGCRRITKAEEPDAWWVLVNADGVVVTQVDDGDEDGPGIATSSASVPSLVASMLGHLDVTDGNTVLDIGTGTGWTSALLCNRLGDEAVTTVEVDPAVAAAAGERLAGIGSKPGRVVGDGLLGHPAGGPYDRIHSTAAVRRVPLAWIEQTRPGGIIVTPWGTPYANAGLLRLEVGGPGEPTHGRFVDDVSFMWMRAQRPHSVGEPAGVPDDRGSSAMDPELALEDVNAAFAIGLRVPGIRYEHVWDEADPGATFRMRLSDGAGSWASVRYAGWDAGDAVHQSGARRLWDEVVGARLWWLEEGRPDLRRFGVTVTPDGAQSVWLDSPENPVPLRG